MDWVIYYKLKRWVNHTSTDWKVKLVWFWLRDDDKNKLRFFIIEIWWNKYKINLWVYEYKKHIRKVFDWTAEWQEVWWVDIEKFWIDSIQKWVKNWF